MNVEIITVNYNTPDLVERLVKSLRYNGEDYPVRIIDGSDAKNLFLLHEAMEPFTDVTIEAKGYNIHHGRGMNLGISTSDAKYCLLMDSDNFIKKPITPILERIGDRSILGWYCYVNEAGISNPRTRTDEHWIKYFHPSFMLIETLFYKSSNVKFIHHGAPCIKFMQYHQPFMDDLSVDVCEELGIPFEGLNDIISLKGRGTVSRFGYGLR